MYSGRINVDKIRIISFGGDYGKEYSLYYRNLDTGAWTSFENKQDARGITDFNLNGLRTNAVKFYQNGVTENFYWSMREFLVYGEKNG